MSTQYLRFSARTAAPQRSSLLERLLAGADGAAAVVDWRNDAFRLIAPQSQCMPSLGAAALYAGCGAVAAAWAFLATPVHYIVEISNVRMAPHGILSLALADAEILAVVLERKPWVGEFDPLSGVILHEHEDVMPEAAE